MKRIIAAILLIVWWILTPVLTLLTAGAIFVFDNTWTKVNNSLLTMLE